MAKSTIEFIAITIFYRIRLRIAMISIRMQQKIFNIVENGYPYSILKTVYYYLNKISRISPKFITKEFLNARYIIML